MIATSGAAPLAGLAKRFLRQLADYGLLAAERNPTKLLSPSGFGTRLALVQRFLEGVEAAYGLRFEEGEWPLLYNTATWPAGAPIALRTTAGCAVTPSMLLGSYLGTWRLDWNESTEPSTSAFRLLRAVLYAWHRDGLARGVDCLVDLLAHGYVTRAASVTLCLAALGRGCRQGGEADVVRAFFAGAVPGDDDGWRSTPMDPPDEAPGSGGCARSACAS